MPVPDPAPSVTRTLRVFDPEVFGHLALHRPALQIELIELFLQQGRETRARLPALAAEGCEPFRNAIHALVGSARIVAAVQLCAVIERAHEPGRLDSRESREQAGQEVAEAFDAVAPVLDAFAGELRRAG